MSFIYYLSKISGLFLVCLVISYHVASAAAFSSEQERNRRDFIQLAEQIGSTKKYVHFGSKEKLEELADESVRLYSKELAQALFDHLSTDDDFVAMSKEEKINFIFALNYGFLSSIDYLKWSVLRFYSTSDQRMQTGKLIVKDKPEINVITQNLFSDQQASLYRLLIPLEYQVLDDFTASFDKRRETFLPYSGMSHFSWLPQPFKFTYLDEFLIEKNILVFPDTQSAYEIQILGLFVAYRKILEKQTFQAIIESIKEIFSNDIIPMNPFRLSLYCEYAKSFPSFSLPFVYLLYCVYHDERHDFILKDKSLIKKAKKIIVDGECDGCELAESSSDDDEHDFTPRTPRRGKNKKSSAAKLMGECCSLQ